MKNDIKIEIIKKGDIVSLGLDLERDARADEVLDTLYAGVCGTIEEVAKQLEIPSDELMQLFLIPLVKKVMEQEEA